MNINEMMNLKIQDKQYKTFLNYKLLKEEELKSITELSKMFKDEEISEAFSKIKKGTGSYEDIEFICEGEYIEVFVSTQRNSYSGSFNHYWLVPDDNVYDVCYNYLKRCIENDGYDGWNQEFVEEMINIEDVNDYIYLEMADYLNNLDKKELLEEFKINDFEVDEDEDLYSYIDDFVKQYVDDLCYSETLTEMYERGYDIENFIDMESFIEEAILIDGEAIFLATGDNKDREITINGELFHLYMR